MSEKKKRIFGITAAVVVILVIAIFSAISAKREAERKAAEEKIAKEEQKVAEDIVLPIAKEFGLEDLKFEYIEDGGYHAVCYFSSEDYASLSDEDKVGLLVAVAAKTRLNDDYFPSGSDYYSQYFDFRVISNGHTYKDFTTDGMSWLMEDGEKIFEIETSYARDVERSLNSKLNQGSSSGTGSSSGQKCSTCNGRGMVKYYYGGSALEAALDGYDDYEYGQCGSCHGTGVRR